MRYAEIEKLRDFNKLKAPAAFKELSPFRGPHLPLGLKSVLLVQLMLQHKHDDIAQVQKYEETTSCHEVSTSIAVNIAWRSLHAAVNGL